MDFYVAGETGSDVGPNPGTNPIAPRRTMPISVDSGDTVHCSEKIRSSSGGASTTTYTGKSNLTIGQWGGRPQAEFRGDAELPGSGWAASTNAWQKTIATGLTLSAVVYKWDANIDGDGRHYGHLVPDTLVNVQNATGAIGRYNYDGGTGVLTVYLGGDNPNTSGFPVAWVQANNLAAIFLNGAGSGRVVTGVNFALYCGTGNSYCVRMDDAQGSAIRRCVARDAGVHPLGFLGQATANLNNVIEDCTMHGMEPGGTGTVHYQVNASGACAGARNRRCTVWLYRWLGTDGNARAGLSAMGQIGFFTHGDAGTPIQDVELDACTVREFEVGGYPWSSAQTPAVAPADYLKWAAYPFRVTASSYLNGAAMRMTEFRAIRRSRLHLPLIGATHQGVFAVAAIDLAGGAGTRRLLLESCEIIVNLDAPNATDPPVRAFRVDNSGAGDARIILVNCSSLNTGVQSGATDFRTWFSFEGRTGSPFQVRGCVFSHSVTGANHALCIGDNNANAGGSDHDFKDNVYKNISTGRYSQFIAAIDTEVEWLSVVDNQGGRVETGTIYPNAPTDLSLNPGSVIWVDRRATSAVVPTAGINNRYADMFGAYQYPRFGRSSRTRASDRARARR